ncbi:MAG: BON domain-containing protein [Nitrospira sp.]|nr:BON domain-containing protein [Nitrospira sp.]
MWKGFCVLNVSLAVISCMSEAVALADKSSSHGGPPSDQTINRRQSDERIKYTIEQTLRTDGRVDWEILDVEVRQGLVRLYGEVTTAEQKGLATDIASTVPGVMAIINNIIVDVPPSRDHILQKAIWNTLRGVDVLQTDTLRISTKDGVVTLSGMLETAVQKAAAVDAAKSVSGVKHVINQIHVGALPFQTEQEKLIKENRMPMP